jgi:hypothetical protein
MSAMPTPVAFLQSTSNSQITAKKVMGYTPACTIRAVANYSMRGVNVPDASITAYTSKPLAKAERDTNVKHTSVDTPEMMS